MNNSIESRRQLYFSLSSQIAQVQTADLLGKFAAGATTGGWGRNHVIRVGRHKVFVKRISVTDLESVDIFETRNLFDLPTYYNYGVGSAGFGVGRELLTHVKTTNWVLAGDIEGFPLLYHHRVIPYAGDQQPVDMERHRRYVDYWGGNENIGTYMLERAGANHELVLFLEYVPNVLHPWLAENPHRTDAILTDLNATIAFLRRNGVVHFDAHFHNILTDGQRTYLTDFGLVLDRNFALTAAESAFFKRNSLYDYGRVLSSLSFLVRHRYEALPESERLGLITTYGQDPAIEPSDMARILLKNIQDLDTGAMNLDNRYVASLVKFSDAIDVMHQFYVALYASKSDARFPEAELRRMLMETGVI